MTRTALDLLCVDPAHQRRGVGRMLVKWGTQVADNMGVKVLWCDNLCPAQAHRFLDCCRIIPPGPQTLRIRRISSRDGALHGEVVGAVFEQTYTKLQLACAASQCLVALLQSCSMQTKLSSLFRCTAISKTKFQACRSQIEVFMKAVLVETHP